MLFGAFMSFFRVLFISLGLGADAFAASVARGLGTVRLDASLALRTGAVFGFFQGLMPLAGYFAGGTVAPFIDPFDNYVAAALLIFIGVKTAHGAREDDSFALVGTSVAALLPVGVATSVDALAVGVAFSLDPAVNIFPVCAVIALVTFCLCVIGVMIGAAFGAKHRKAAQLAGGAILIIMGVRFLFG